MAKSHIPATMMPPPPEREEPSPGQWRVRSAVNSAIRPFYPFYEALTGAAAQILPEPKDVPIDLPVMPMQLPTFGVVPRLIKGVRRAKQMKRIQRLSRSAGNPNLEGALPDLVPEGGYREVLRKPALMTKLEDAGIPNPTRGGPAPEPPAPRVTQYMDKAELQGRITPRLPAGWDEESTLVPVSYGGRNPAIYWQTQGPRYGRLTDFPGEGNPTQGVISRRELPPTVYHVTGDVPGIEGAGTVYGELTPELYTQGRQSMGMGGGKTISGVSIMPSRYGAQNMARELKRMVGLARLELPSSYDDFMNMAAEDAALADNYIQARTGRKFSTVQSGNPNLKETLQAYMDDAIREVNAGPSQFIPGTVTPDEEASARLVAIYKNYLLRRGRLAGSDVDDPIYEFLQVHNKFKDPKYLRKGGVQPPEMTQGVSYGDPIPGITNPVLLNSAENYSRVDPDKIGIIPLRAKDIPERVPITGGPDFFQSEFQVKSDIPARTNLIRFRRK